MKPHLTHCQKNLDGADKKLAYVFKMEYFKVNQVLTRRVIFFGEKFNQFKNDFENQNFEMFKVGVHNFSKNAYFHYGLMSNLIKKSLMVSNISIYISSFITLTWSRCAKVTTYLKLRPNGNHQPEVKRVKQKIQQYFWVKLSFFLPNS